MEKIINIILAITLVFNGITLNRSIKRIQKIEKYIEMRGGFPK